MVFSLPKPAQRRTLSIEKQSVRWVRRSLPSFDPWEAEHSLVASPAEAGIKTVSPLDQERVVSRSWLSTDETVVRFHLFYGV